MQLDVQIILTFLISFCFSPEEMPTAIEMEYHRFHHHIFEFTVDTTVFWWITMCFAGTIGIYIHISGDVLDKFTYCWTETLIQCSYKQT